MDGKIKIPLEKRVDSLNKTYYIGKIEAPILIDCKDGVCFLIFVSEAGDEEIQIAPLKNNSIKSKKNQNYL